MPETLGRGAFTDESRIERGAKRAHENAPATGKPTTPASPAIAALNQQVRTATESTLTTGGSSMSATTSFAHQIALLDELKQYLSDFQDRLVGVSLKYQHKVEELHQAGMMDETYSRYAENELAQTQAEMRRLIEHISANDLPRVASERAFLEQKV